MANSCHESRKPNRRGTGAADYTRGVNDATVDKEVDSGTKSRTNRVLTTNSSRIKTKQNLDARSMQSSLSSRGGNDNPVVLSSTKRLGSSTGHSQKQEGHLKELEIATYKLSGIDTSSFKNMPALTQSPAHSQGGKVEVGLRGAFEQ